MLDKQAAKAQAQAQKQADKQAAKTQKQAAKQQRQAAKQQRTTTAAAPLTRPAATAAATAQAPIAVQSSATATAAPAPAATTTSAAPARARAAARRAAARRRAVIHRRALARRAAARRRAAGTTIAAAPPAAATVIRAAVTTPAPAAPTRKPAARPKPKPAAPKTSSSDRGPVTVVSHTVRDIVHVIPGWAKVLILALAALLGLAALLIFAAAMRNRRLRKLSARLLDEVGTLSTALLPVIPARVGTLAVTVAYRPAEGLAAGGDFYDVFPLDRGRVGIVVGDVSGHGRESLGPATFTRHMVRSYLEGGLAPRAALQLAGKVVDEQDRDDFATVIAAVHDPSAGTLSYATAGHPPPIITGPGAHRPLTVAAAPPLGVDEPTGVRQTTLPVAPGSTVCFITDGLIEARKGHRILGMARVERIVRDLGHDATAERVVATVAREADSMPDDVAVALIHVQGGASTASTLRVEEIEVRRDELEGERLRRFLDACGLTAGDVAGVIRDARPGATRDGSILLRVRLADGRSGVDILPVHSAGPGAELAALRA